VSQRDSRFSGSGRWRGDSRGSKLKPRESFWERSNVKLGKRSDLDLSVYHWNSGREREERGGFWQKGGTRIALYVREEIDHRAMKEGVDFIQHGRRISKISYRRED